MFFKKTIFVIGMCLFLILPCGCSSSKKEGTEISNKEKKIEVSQLKISPISSDNCDVNIGLVANYKNIKTGTEPKIWWHLICGSHNSAGYKPLKDIKSSQNKVKLNTKVSLAYGYTAHGTCSISCWVEDGDVESNRLESTCVFK